MWKILISLKLKIKVLLKNVWFFWFSKIFDRSLLTTLKEPNTADIAKVAIINIISMFQKVWNKQLMHLHSQTKMRNIDNNPNKLKMATPPK